MFNVQVVEVRGGNLHIVQVFLEAVLVLLYAVAYTGAVRVFEEWEKVFDLSCEVVEFTGNKSLSQV